MLDWFLRIVSVAAAFWLLHVYVVAKSGESFSPASVESLKHSGREVWRAAEQTVDKFDVIIFSPFSIGLVLVAALAYGLIRPSGR